MLIKKIGDHLSAAPRTRAAGTAGSGGQ
jgi:hypothetical protein